MSVSEAQQKRMINIGAHYTQKTMSDVETQQKIICEDEAQQERISNGEAQ